jgi:hypothetical protein
MQLTCTCPAGTSAVISSICVDCTQISNNAGPNGTNTICYCATPYQWYWNTTSLVGTCDCDQTFEITISANPKCFDCTTLLYGTGKANIISGQCQCLTNFVWDGNANNCYCPTSKGWTFDGSANPPTCTCNVLTSVAFADGYCFDCTSVAHHDTPAVNTGHNNCAVLQYWAFSYDAVTTHSGSSSCVSSTDILCPGVGTGCFDCASLTAATYGTGIIDPNVAGACQCLPNFIWDGSTNTCSCPTSKGWTLTDSASPPTCTCPIATSATSL